MRTTLSILTASFQVLLASTALAQLTTEDIEALRERGKREGWTFTVGENAATNYPLEALCGYVGPTIDFGHVSQPVRPREGLRDRSQWDWRAWRCVTPVRDQLQCGSCWAFGAIGAMESIIYINDGVGTDLSEQWLVSCTDAGNCVQGNHAEALSYLECGAWQDPCGDSGAVWESDFPYEGWDAPCGCPYPHPYCISDWHWVSGFQWLQPSVAEIKQALLDYGPITATVYVNDAFHAYTGGVFNACEDETTNHCVLLVGWDDADEAWILKNSWGEDWGEGGHMRIVYECSRIGYYSIYVDYADSNAGVWVDFGYGGGESGSFWSPYNTLTEGVDAVATGGVLSIKAGSTGGSWMLTKAMTIRAGGGTVTIGE